MAELKEEEIRRFIGYLGKIVGEETVSEIEDELRSEDGTEIIREPEFLKYFSSETIEIENWRLRIIPYTAMRMIQRGIGQKSVVNLFREFIEVCRKNDEIIVVGAYTLFGKANKKNVTLRIDVDEVSDETGEAHAVTVFVGSGNTEDTIFISLEQ